MNELDGEDQAGAALSSAAVPRVGLGPTTPPNIIQLSPAALEGARVVDPVFLLGTLIPA